MGARAGSSRRYGNLARAGSLDVLLRLGQVKFKPAVVELRAGAVGANLLRKRMLEEEVSLLGIAALADPLDLLVRALLFGIGLLLEAGAILRDKPNGA